MYSEPTIVPKYNRNVVAEPKTDCNGYVVYCPPLYKNSCYENKIIRPLHYVCDSQSPLDEDPFLQTPVVKRKNGRSKSKLINAIRRNYQDIVSQILLDKQLNLNSCPEGRSPLCCAVKWGHFEIVRLLLEAGADVSRRGKTEETEQEMFPLHIASCNGNLKLLKLLMSYGADINLRDCNHRTPLHLAALYGHSDLIKWMLSVGAIINMLQLENMSALQIASCLGHLDICQTLVEGGAYLSFCNEDGWTALHSAASYGFKDIVKLLLEAGADKSMRIIPTNDTVLHIACSNGSVDIIRMLLAAGIPIESRNFLGDTPLLTAVENNKTYAAFFLIKAGANVNAVTSEGMNAVGLSLSKNGNRILTTILIQAGGSVRKTFDDGYVWGDWLETYIIPLSSQPRTLQDLCYPIIRQKLAPNLQRKAGHLPLPPALRRVAAMEDVGLQVTHSEYGLLAANVNADPSDVDRIMYSVAGLIFEPVDE